MWVEPQSTPAADCGDEPLLLARHFPTLVAKDRCAGAREIVTDARASVIVMDDGLQSARLARDLSVAVVDGARGLGNGLVLPAGPLRAPIAPQLATTDAIVVVWPPGSDVSRPAPSVARLRANFGGPIFEAHVVADGDLAAIVGKKVIAYAGIGAPERFFSLLTSLGAKVVEARTFADHQRLSEDEARDLMARAQSRDAMLATTEKDLARLAGEAGHRAQLALQSWALPIRMEFSGSDRDRLSALIELTCRNSRAGG